MVLFEGSHATTEPTLNPWEMQRLMGLGINIANVLETPFEGTFALAPTEENFQMFHDAGFANVRIPVNWGNHMMVEEPYTMDKAFLTRVTELVDASLAHGLITVITAHHEWWIDVVETAKTVYEWKFKLLPRFEALWRQVGEHFRHHRQLLIFGILNEPHQLKTASLNELHRCALDAIRHTNPSRIVTISGKDFANPRWLLDNPGALWIPRDPQVMLEVHITEPHGFTGTSPSKTAWGTAEDHQKLRDWVHQIEVYGRRNNLPIYAAEFGCSNEQKGDHRQDWIEANWKEMRGKGFCASLWDDGDRFSIYNRENGTWDQAILAALQRSLPGLKGVGFRRAGGGLGGDSVDPTTDLQRRIENCFKRLSLHLDEVDTLPALPDHNYISHTLIPPEDLEASGSDEDSSGYRSSRRRSSNRRRSSGLSSLGGGR